MKYIGSWVAGGMAIMCTITVALVLYVDYLTDENTAKDDTIAVLQEVVNALRNLGMDQNRVIEALGGTPIPLPVEVVNPPSTTSTTRTTTTSTSTTSTSTTSTTTPPPPPDCVVGPVCLPG